LIITKKFKEILMASSIENFVSKVEEVCEKAEKLLEANTTNKNLQVPELMNMLVRDGVIENAKQWDPVVRQFIRSHSEWRIIQGINGGITKSAKTQKKTSTSKEVDKVKEELRAVVEQKAAKIQTSKEKIEEFLNVEDNDKDVDLK